MNFWWKAGLCVFLAASLTACGGGGGGGRTASKPRIRFVNASPDSTALTYSIDGSVEASAIPYLGLSDKFKDKDPDSYDLSVREDAGSEDLDAVVGSFSNEKEYLITTVGLEAYGAEPVKRARIVSPEIDLTVPNGTKSRIYVLHGFLRATGFDTPNIDLRNPGDNPQYKVENIDFGSIGTLTIDATTQTCVARRTGTESVYATQTFTFDAGGIYLAIVGGIEGGSAPLDPKITFIKIN